MRPDLSHELRYYPAFLLLALGLGIGLSCLFQVTITSALVDQYVVPRWHIR